MNYSTVHGLGERETKYFACPEAMVAAMSDKRYATDAAYRQEVLEKMAGSSVLGIELVHATSVPNPSVTISST